MLKMAPPPHAARIRTRPPRGATLNIVGLHRPIDVEARVSNNVENGTSAARGPTRQSPRVLIVGGGMGGKSEIRNPKSKPV
jgi:hypothetical protein